MMLSSRVPFALKALPLLNCRLNNLRLIKNHVFNQTRGLKFKVKRPEKPNVKPERPSKKKNTAKKEPIHDKNKANASQRKMMDAILKSSPKIEKEVKPRNTLEQSAPKTVMRPPKPNKDYISFADRLTPTVIQTSLGVTDEVFSKLIRRINFDGPCDSVILKLIYERVFYLELIEQYLASFPKGTDLNKVLQEKILTQNLKQSRDFIYTLRELKVEKYPEYFYTSSREVMSLKDLKSAKNITWMDKLKSSSMKALGMKSVFNHL